MLGNNACIIGFERGANNEILPAEEDLRLKIGQYIHSINSQNTIGIDFELILEMVRKAIIPIEIRVGSIPEKEALSNFIEIN